MRKKVPNVIKKYGGEYLARGGEHQVVEGEDNLPRIVIIKFPTYEKALEWYHSDEYKPVKIYAYKILRELTLLLKVFKNYYVWDGFIFITYCHSSSLFI